jgi:hypothetical protein
MTIKRLANYPVETMKPTRKRMVAIMLLVWLAYGLHWVEKTQ